MTEVISFSIVMLVGVYLVGLAVSAIFNPTRTTQFFLGFAASARVHYVELVVRGIAGAAVVMQAPHMRYPDAFAIAGWIVLATTIALATLPWRYHRAFAERAVPRATKHMTLIAIGSFLLGGFILIALLSPYVFQAGVTRSSP